MDDLQAVVDKVEPEDELGEEVEAAAGDEPEEADEKARGWVAPSCCLVQPVSGPAPQQGLPAAARSARTLSTVRSGYDATLPGRAAVCLALERRVCSCFS